MGSNRWVHLMFALGGMIIAFIAVKAIDWIWSYIDKPNALIADVAGIGVGLLVAFLAWRDENTFNRAAEIAAELKKVTWPTRKETSAATTVVIVTVIISAVILGLFDLIWSWATGLLYA